MMRGIKFPLLRTLEPERDTLGLPGQNISLVDKDFTRKSQLNSLDKKDFGDKYWFDRFSADDDLSTHLSRNLLVCDCVILMSGFFFLLRNNSLIFVLLVFSSSSFANSNASINEL